MISEEKIDQTKIHESNSIIAEQKKVLSFILNKKKRLIKHTVSASDNVNYTEQKNTNEYSIGEDKNNKNSFITFNNNFNELCPVNEINKYNSNMRPKIQKSSSVKLIKQSNNNNIKKERLSMNSKSNQFILKRTSSKKENINKTYVIKNNMQQIEMRRQEALSTLSVSSIEFDLENNNQDETKPMIYNYQQQQQQQQQNSQLSCASCRHKKCCEYCANTVTMPSQLTMESSINNVDKYESWLDDVNILSSTPMCPEPKQQQQPQTNKINPFTIIRNCILPIRLSKNKTDIKKKFKLESVKTVKQEIKVVKKYKIQTIHVKQTNTDQVVTNLKRARKSSNHHHQKHTRRVKLPRTSSFNSNSDEMESADFGNNNDILFESVLPSKCNQNFNNLGDFVVWYV